MMDLFASTSGRTLPSQSAWLNEPSDWSFKQPNILSVAAPEHADFFVDPARTSHRACAPFLFFDVQGDFTVSSRVEVEMHDEADSGCLMIMSNETTWAKLCLERVYQKPTIVSVVTRETSDDCNGQPLAVPSVFLRASRQGNCFAFHYSEDGQFWRLARYFSLSAAAKVRVGVVAQAPTGNGCRVTFHGFQYSDLPVTQLRSGE